MHSLLAAQGCALESLESTYSRWSFRTARFRYLPAECLASLPMDMTQTLHPLDLFALPHEALEALSDQVLDMSRRPVLDEASSHEASSEASAEDRSVTLSSDSNEEVRPLKNKKHKARQT